MSQIEDLLRKELDSGLPEAARFNRALRLLAKHRSLLIQNDLMKKHGTTVQGGPFAGMNFIENSAEGCHIPKLLGCYEQELHPIVASVAQRKYETILNIGSAEGYYAVGFKRLCPDAIVVACDTDPNAQTACKALADRNSVSLDIRGTFAPADFAHYTGRSLVWCDIEGDERTLLNPVLAPQLTKMDIVVELHPSADAPDIRVVPGRFAQTHDIALVWPDLNRMKLPDMFRNFGHLDQLLAVWEWRSTPTPWAIMISKAGVQAAK